MNRYLLVLDSALQHAARGELGRVGDIGGCYHDTAQPLSLDSESEFLMIEAECGGGGWE